MGRASRLNPNSRENGLGGKLPKYRPGWRHARDLARAGRPKVLERMMSVEQKRRQEQPEAKRVLIKPKSALVAEALLEPVDPADSSAEKS